VFAAAFTALLLVLPGQGHAADYVGNSGVLPAGTQIDNEALFQPREVFHSEAGGGTRSNLVKLGDMAFHAPSILGGPARQAGISCDTCHINGTTNPRLFIPGMSTRPGTFDTTGPLFNPAVDNGVLDAVSVPSLRGARLLAPYGHQGRLGSLREFVDDVIVNEFAGPAPSAALLDALVAYIQDIGFLPNRRLGTDGKLLGRTSDAEKRGQALFFKPFAHDPQLSCAGCHVPTGAFVDHGQHDVGSDGVFKTPTLLNANFNAPYFHDGRFATYAEVIGHFDRVFYLGLSAQDRTDLVAYLEAIGDGERAYERDGVDLRLAEINDFVSVLDRAIPQHDAGAVALTVDTVGGELRELTEKFPERKDPSVTTGKEDRAQARAALKDLVLCLSRVATAADAGHFDVAAGELANYRAQLANALPLLKAAEPSSLFDPAIHDAHFGALRQLYLQGVDPREKRVRIDRD
jgi:cytochrome c peroxidase